MPSNILYTRVPRVYFCAYTGAGARVCDRSTLGAPAAGDVVVAGVVARVCDQSTLVDPLPSCTLGGAACSLRTTLGAPAAGDVVVVVAGVGAGCGVKMVLIRCN